MGDVVRAGWLLVRSDGDGDSGGGCFTIRRLVSIDHRTRLIITLRIKLFKNIGKRIIIKIFSIDFFDEFNWTCGRQFF